jgi:DNA-binding response OmpR family regulator
MADSRAMGSASPPRSLRVVIADDDADTLVTLAAILQDEGHEVYGFGTGREALAAARMYRADVMIVDIQMPDMTGYDIARRVREHLADHPLVIAISWRWKSETDMLLSVAVGFDHHLMKPCDPDKLIGYLDEWSAEQDWRSGRDSNPRPPA